MKALISIAYATLVFSGSVLAAEHPIKPKDWIAFTKDTIGCANFDDAIEASRLSRERKGGEAAKLLSDHKLDCQVFEASDGRDWPVWEVEFASSKLPPGMFAISISSPVSPRSTDDRLWAIVYLRDVIKQ